MDFQKIKKVIFNHTPYPQLPPEEKAIALNIIFTGSVLMFLFILLVSYFFSPSNFFHDPTDKIEKITIFASFVYLFIRLRNAIQYIGGPQVYEDLGEKGNKITARFVLNTTLPIIIIFIIEYWLKSNNYFGWLESFQRLKIIN